MTDTASECYALRTMFRMALAAFAMFLVTVAPFKAAPVFSALTRHMDRARQRRTAVRSIVLAGIILAFFGLLGDDVLQILGISLAGVRVGGGILLMLVAIQLVTEHEPGGGSAAEGGPAGEDSDIAVFPIATPMIAGPATITAIIVMATELKNEPMANLVMVAMLLLVLLITLGCLLSEHSSAHGSPACGGGSAATGARSASSAPTNLR